MSIDTLDPEQLAAFVAELESAAFVAQDVERTTWDGPLRESLRPFTSASTMRLVLQDGWPYVQPLLHVEGIRWWHAAHDRPCLWQEGDNSKRWLTLEGIGRRIDEWAEKATAGFKDLDGAALDPHLYFDSYSGVIVGIDEALISPRQDGQHGQLRLQGPEVGLSTVVAAPGSTAASGHWFYRDQIAAPPANLEDFIASLRPNQLERYERTLRRRGRGLFVLAWPTPHGLSVLAISVADVDGGRRATAFSLTATSQVDRLRRAGPDAAALRDLRVVVFGAGAIGSHLAIVLARSGLGHLTIVDQDVLTPTVVIRHAATEVGQMKTHAIKRLIEPYDWTTVTVVDRITTKPAELTRLVEGYDLCIDATGGALFAELLSRVAANAAIPMLSVALYRGGRVARVRRQADADTPIVERYGHWRYPAIPESADPRHDYVGVETGCAAPIHNAPPAAVVGAAALAARVAIDQLTGRRAERDEILEVIEPIEAPFNRRGRFAPTPPVISITDAARTAMIKAAAAAHPKETGGVVIGVLDGDGAPYVVEAVELEAERPSTHAYVVPSDMTTAAIDDARTRNPDVGYLGEWHSHPSDQPASPTDAATMLRLSDQPETRDPVLLVLRPKQDHTFGLDAYVVLDRALRHARHLAAGPLLTPEEAT